MPLDSSDKYVSSFGLTFLIDSHRASASWLLFIDSCLTLSVRTFSIYFISFGGYTSKLIRVGSLGYFFFCFLSFPSSFFSSYAGSGWRVGEGATSRSCYSSTGVLIGCDTTSWVVATVDSAASVFGASRYIFVGASSSSMSFSYYNQPNFSFKLSMRPYTVNWFPL